MATIVWKDKTVTYSLKGIPFTTHAFPTIEHAREFAKMTSDNIIDNTQS